jgi:hypothetical protein
MKKIKSVAILDEQQVNVTPDAGVPGRSDNKCRFRFSMSAGTTSWLFAG